MEPKGVEPKVKGDKSFDAIVLGAGAAGLMCAIEAGKRGRRVIVLERAEKIGKKILISGGGRCNFTNIHTRPENFISANPHFAKSALARYMPADFIALVEKHGIAYHEKTLGQLFCDGSAQQIVSMLEEECRQVGVSVLTNIQVKEVVRAAGDGPNFEVRTNKETFYASAVVVATGGLSIPKMGATAFGYELARKFGLHIVETRPALVPLTFNEKDSQAFYDLSGVSTEVIAAIGKQKFREKMLITHRGLSGPAILQISSYWKTGAAIALDLAPDADLTAPLRESPAGRDMNAAKAAFRQALPARLAERWLEVNTPEAAADRKTWSNHALEQLERKAHRWEVVPSGTEGYAKAEVTVGGVDTNELSAQTMEAKKIPGLYFIGEVVDVTGHLGGFNFQWAWASGFSAGRAI
ncbi:MAG: NAD(P)/FAD-dependent oxidoreductase [Terriglobales bacterium]